MEGTNQTYVETHSHERTSGTTDPSLDSSLGVSSGTVQRHHWAERLSAVKQTHRHHQSCSKITNVVNMRISDELKRC